MTIHTISLEGRVREAFDKAGLTVLIYERATPDWIRLTVAGTDKTISEVSVLAVQACSLAIDVRAIRPLRHAQFCIELEVDDRTSIHGKPATEWL